jgi:hypothetical protein
VGWPVGPTPEGAVMKSAVGIAIAVSILVGSSSLGAHEGDHGEGPTDLVFKIGKTGEVNINRDVKLGTYVVKRAKYTLTHEVQDQRHLFVLTEINKKKEPSQLAVYNLAGNFIANSDRVKKSSVTAKEMRDHNYEIVTIQIAGENGNHVFPTNIGGISANR